jgi:hypothetical protein
MEKYDSPSPPLVDTRRGRYEEVFDTWCDLFQVLARKTRGRHLSPQFRDTTLSIVHHQMHPVSDKHGVENALGAVD